MSASQRDTHEQTSDQNQDRQTQIKASSDATDIAHNTAFNSFFSFKKEKNAFHIKPSTERHIPFATFTGKGRHCS
jgi:hypothetical protein